jgi:hypothetical protein
VFGKGKAVAFPKLDGPSNFSSYEWAYKSFEQPQLWVGHESWEAPHNMEELAGAVRWTLNHDLPVIVTGPESVIIELAGKPGKQILHLLNYDCHHPAHAVTVRFKEPMQSARLYDPLTGAVTDLAIAGDNSVVVDKVDIYAIIEAAVSV